MSQIVYEVLDGGLVTSTHPSKLRPGEMPQTINAFYYPWHSSIASPPGITVWGVVASANQEVSGLCAARFDNGSHYLVAQASGKYWLADAETDASSFASATSVTAGNQLVAVQSDNHYYVLNGSGENLVLLQDGSFRKHGLVPTSTKLQFNGLVASAFSANATGFYEYWHTEVVRFSDNSELESTFDGLARTVNVTSLATAPAFELPGQPANYRQGTHISYRIYRSEMKALENEQKYPVGTKLADVSTTDKDGVDIKPVVFVDSTSTTNTGNKTAGSNNAVVVKGVATSSLVVGGSVQACVSATGDGALWRVSATGSASAFILGRHGAVVTLYNFNPGVITGNIAGIEVVVRAAGNVASIADVWVSIGKRDDVTHGLVPFPPNAQYPQGLPTAIYTPADFLGIKPELSRIAKRKTVVETSLGVAADMTFGGQYDTWIPPEYGWPLNQFGTDFSVQLAVVFNGAAVSTDRVDVDFVRINIFYAATNAATTTGKLYDAITIAGTSAELKFGANGKPPVASTGAMFEGSLVLDDVANPGKLVWSVPGFTDYFPQDVYFNVLETGDNDTITFLGTVNDRLVCGTKGTLWRINYLPNEQDASFSRGRAASLISDKVGILRPTAACLFTNAMGLQELAFVDTNGIFATNGYTIRSLSEDLRWVGFSTGVFSSISSSIYSQVKALINDPRTQTLRLVLGNGYYTASYAPRHAKPGSGLKWAGPGDARKSSAQPSSAVVIRRNNGVWIVVYGYKANSGAVAREDSNDSSAFTPFTGGMALKTRDIFPSGVGEEASLDSLIVEGIDRGLSTNDQSPSWTASVTQLFTNDTPPPNTVLTYAGAVSQVHVSEVPCGSVNANGFRVNLSPTSVDSGMVEIHQIGFALTPYGEGETRRA